MTMAHCRVSLAQFRHILGSSLCHFRGKTPLQTLRCSTTRSFCEKQFDEHTYLKLQGSHSNASFYSDAPGSDEDFSQSPPKELYDGHIPTTVLQKRLLATGSAFMSLYDPYRDDMVAVLGEVTGHTALRRLHQKMQDDPEGRQILEERPRINTQTVNMDWLASLPQGTLGREYVDFMKKNKITSDSRSPVRFVDDPDLAYVMQRYREIHDLNHSLLGMPATMLGEVTVKWFEMINTQLPMTALGALFGPLRVKRRQISKLTSVHIPWVLKTAPWAKLLLNVYFEKRWEQPVTEVRSEIGIQLLHTER